MELLLLNNKDLVEYSIVGKNDDKWGEVPVIVAVKKNKSVTSNQILHLFNEKVAKYKIPKEVVFVCLLYTSPSPRDRQKSRMPSSA